MEAGAATNGGLTTADEETNRQSRRKEGGPSLNSLAIMRKATTPTNISSVEIKDWRRVVYEGVLLENNTQKFWVDEKLHKNCFLVLPKAFHIAGGDEESCWKWITVKETCFRSPVDIPVPRLVQLSWVYMQGKFRTSALSPNTTYEVAFVVKLSRNSYKWPLPVNIELDLPDGNKLIRTENLERKPKEKWMKLRAGEFMMDPKTVGTIVFTLHETCQMYKSGLILKGILIHPKN
ncbi:protein PHLOEM PROTEIN 2-LIKE A1-like [Syzygium oleosum]|uniref:protein PHLOEM PROTEIN 2-LIKE A1-like n=1 Tax=Syzygium oleosum TaxID=219896 RepID=UPI0024BAD599|nr:protein PHLOEM PROTEIN 2-LIKE A1-like [Syzygium oleosum]